MPELVVEGLAAGDARALLDSVLTGPLDVQVRDRIVAETRGNPLALLELPRGLTPARAGGRVRTCRRGAAVGAHRGGFQRRLDAFRPTPDSCCWWPPPSRSVIRCWCGGRPSGSGSAPRPPPPRRTAGLLEFGTRVLFRHPLVRSAVYRSALVQDRQRRAPRAGRGHRSGGGIPTGVPGIARRPRPGPMRTSPTELERSAGSSAGPRWFGRGGRVPRTRGDADARTDAPSPAPARRGPDEARRRRVRRGTGTAGGGRGWRRLTRCRPIELQRLRGQIALMQRRGYRRGSTAALARPGVLTRWTPTWRARRIWRRSGPRCGRADLDNTAGVLEAAKAARVAPARPRTAAGGRCPARCVRAAVDRGIYGGRANAYPST